MKNGKKTIIVAGWMIDGSGDPAAANVRICMEKGMFSSIQTDRDGCKKGAADPQAVVREYEGSTVLPLFVDCHVHLTMSGSPDQAARVHQLKRGFEESRAAIEGHLQDHFRNGILAVRDGGDFRGFLLAFRKSVQAEDLPPVIIKAAGSAWHNRGRYGKIIGRTPSPGQSLAEAVAGDLSPIDHVKIINSGLNSLKEFAKPTSAQFRADELQQAVREAEKRGLRTMVHANGEKPVREALAAGCHSIEHGFFMGRENLERMADCRAVWVPTAVTMKAYARLMGKASREGTIALKNLDHQMKQLAAARAAGVTVAVGTDSGSPGVHHGAAVAEEMEIFQMAGYTVEETVRCASLNASDLMGLTAFGQIASGLPACFLVVSGPPGSLPGSLKEIQAIYKDGYPIYRRQTRVSQPLSI